MKRRCLKCHNRGIKVGKIVITGPTACAYCGTEYEVARYKNLPYIATSAVAALFLLAWLSGIFNAIVFLLLSGLWLIFEIAWETFVPLKMRNEVTPDEIVL